MAHREGTARPRASDSQGAAFQAGEETLSTLDTALLAAVAAGEVDLNDLAVRELRRRAAHGRGTQLELGLDDVPLLLQHQAG